MALDEKIKTPFLLCVAGVVLFFLESLADIFLRHFYTDIMKSFLDTAELGLLSEIFLVMAILGIIASIGLGIFVFYSYKKGIKQWHFIVILIASALSFFLTMAFYSLIVLAIGSIIGITKADKK